VFLKSKKPVFFNLSNTYTKKQPLLKVSKGQIYTILQKKTNIPHKLHKM